MYESIKSSDLFQMLNGNLAPHNGRRRQEDRIRDHKIEFYSNNLKNGHITVAEFLLAVSTKNAIPPYGT